MKSVRTTYFSLIYFLVVLYVVLFFTHLSYSCTNDYSTLNNNAWPSSWATFSSDQLDGTYKPNTTWSQLQSTHPAYLQSYNIISIDGTAQITITMGKSVDGSNEWAYIVASSSGDTCDRSADLDGDNILNEYDLTPNDDSPYNAAITAIVKDPDGNVVAGQITDDQGNTYNFGNFPTDWEGYSISEVSPEDANWMTGKDLASGLQSTGIDPNIVASGSTGFEFDGSSIIAGSDSWEGMQDNSDESTIATVPNTSEASTTTGSDSDSDSTHLKNIVNNTDAINKNLENVQKYIGITNDYLAKINAKASKSNTSSGSSTTSVNVDIDEQAIGQAVADALTDSSQTYDSTGTSNMDAYSIDSTEQETISSKYGDRFSLFLTTIQESDLFTVPFEIFSDIPTSTQTTVTESIGSWGGESDSTISFDISIYDPILTVIGNVFFVIGLYAAFKILVVKSAA